MRCRVAIHAAALAAWLVLAGCHGSGGPDASSLDGHASVRLALEVQSLPAGVAEVELRLTRGDADPRVVREPVTGVGALLYLSGVTPGTWLAAVEGFDVHGATIACGFATVDLPAGRLRSVRIPLVAAAACEALELDCGNGADDDVDGATDCADPDCEGLVCGAGSGCGAPAACVRGECVASGPGDCDDGDPCTDDSCDAAGFCVHAPVTCDDGDPCTDDACDPIRGCVATPADCDDGDACTTDSCAAGSGCRHAAVTCDDGDPCTDDACDPTRGCTATPVTCDDGDRCTEDSCAADGVCQHGPVSCDDGDDCTLDSCDPATGCVHEPNPDCEGDCSVAPAGTPCDDADPCTTDDVCRAGACVGGRPTCDDGNACTVDSCDAGTCGHEPVANEQPCADDDPCWPGGVCRYGACLKGPTPLDCDDGDPCTIDVCERFVGCRHDPCPEGYGCDGSTCVRTTLSRGIELRHVPGGPFRMGCAESDEVQLCFLYSDATPHDVTLSPYDVMTTEVTIQHFLDCVADGGCDGVVTCAPGTPLSLYPDHPATCLKRSEAAALCEWAGLRLCTEAEWEKAARGPDTRTYPWGEATPDCTLAVINETGATGDQGCGAATILEVGTRPAGVSPYGALDMIGNAAEWVADGYDASFYTTGPTTDPLAPASATLGVVRGGLHTSALINPQFLYGWYRDDTAPESGPLSVGRYGVRCCR